MSPISFPGIPEWDPKLLKCCSSEVFPDLMGNENLAVLTISLTKLEKRFPDSTNTAEV